MEIKEPRKALKKARIFNGYTQRDMSSLIGITERQYQNLEYGDSFGSEATWDKLEGVLGVPWQTLAAKTRKPTQQ